MTAAAHRNLAGVVIMWELARVLSDDGVDAAMDILADDGSWPDAIAAGWAVTEVD